MIWSPEQIAQLRELRALGIPRSRIATTLGVTPNAVTGALARHVKLPKADPLPPPVWPRPDQCRWIHNRDARHPEWCNNRTAADSAYCPEHHARCFIAPR